MRHNCVITLITFEISNDSDQEAHNIHRSPACNAGMVKQDLMCFSSRNHHDILIDMCILHSSHSSWQFAQHCLKLVLSAWHELRSAETRPPAHMSRALVMRVLISQRIATCLSVSQEHVTTCQHDTRQLRVSMFPYGLCHQGKEFSLSG